MAGNDVRTHAERFTRIEDARQRWEALERRLADLPDVDGLVVTAWLDGEPHVLAVVVGAPSDLFHGTTGTVRDNVAPSVWYRLFARHEMNRQGNEAHHLVIRREPGHGLPL